MIKVTFYFQQNFIEDKKKSVKNAWEKIYANISLLSFINDFMLS